MFEGNIKEKKAGYIPVGNMADWWSRGRGIMLQEADDIADGVVVKLLTGSYRYGCDGCPQGPMLEYPPGRLQFDRLDSMPVKEQLASKEVWLR